MNWRRIWQRGSIGLLLLLTIPQIILWIGINPILERSVIRGVPLVTNGLYRVDTLDIRFDLFNRSLKIENFKLTLDSTQLGHAILSEKPPLITEMRVPKLEVHLRNTWRLLDQQILSLDQVMLLSPQIHVNLPGDAMRTEDAAQDIDINDLYNVIYPQLKGIYIGSFILKAGQLSVRDYDNTNHFKVDDLSLELDRIEVDSTSFKRSNRPLYAEKLNFSVNIADYRVVSLDSTYQVKVQRVGYETTSRHLWLSDLSLSPYETAGNLPISDQNLQYVITMPRIDVNGFELGKILFDKQAILDTIHIASPSVSLTGALERPSTNEEASLELPFDLDLYDFVGPYLKVLSAQTIFVDSCEIVWDVTLGDIPFKGSVGRGSIAFHKTLIDSQNRRASHRWWNSEDTRLMLKAFHIELGDSSYSLEGDSWEIYMQEQHISLMGLRLALPNPDTSVSSNFQLGKVDIWGMRWEDFIQKGRLVMDSLYVDSPFASINILANHNELSKTASQDSVAMIWWDSLQVIHTLSLTNGQLLFNKNISDPTYAFEIKNINLSLNETTLLAGDWKDLLSTQQGSLAFEVQDFVAKTSDGKFLIQTPSLKFSSYNSSLLIDSLSLNPLSQQVQDTSQIAFYFPKVTMSGWNLYTIYKTENLDVDSLIISRPEIQIDQYVPDNPSQSNLPILDPYKLVQGLFDKVSFQNIWIENAAIDHHYHKGDRSQKEQLSRLDIQVRGLEIDSTLSGEKDYTRWANDVQITVRDFSRLLPDSLHEVEVKSLYFSTFAKQLRLRDITCSPINFTSTSAAKWDTKIDYININGIDLYKLLADRELPLEYLDIVAPKIRYIPTHTMSGVFTSKKGMPAVDLYGAISPFIHRLQIDRLILREGDFTVEEAIQGQNNFHAKDILLRLDGFEVDSLAATRSQKPFYADSISVNVDVDSYHIILPDSSYQIEFSDFGLSTADSMLYADSIRVEPLPGSQADALEIGLLLDRIQLEGVDLTELYFKQRLNLTGLHISQPNIHLIVNKRPKRKTIQRDGLDQRDFLTKDPYPKISQVLQLIDIENISIEKGRFVLSGDDIKPLGIKNFSFYAFDFRLDSLAYQQLDSSFLFTQNFAFILEDYEVPLPDSAMYHMYTEKVGLFSRSNYFYIDSLRLVPKYGRQDFASQKGYAAERWELMVPRVSARGLDISRLYRQTDLVAQSINLFLPEMRIYKDKRLPFPIWKRPPMPWDAILNTKTYIHVDTLRVFDGYIWYEERNPDTDTVAWFELTELDLNAYPLTNDEFWILQYPRGKVNATGKIMDIAPMDVTIDFPWAGTSNTHIFEGKVGSIPATDLNPILENTGFVSITDGQIHKAQFWFEANNRTSNGRMRLYYNDLKVNLLSKNLEREQGVVQKLGSGIANAFVVRKDNPRKLLRVGHIGYDREMEKAVLTFWVKSVISGLQSSVGIKSKEMKLKDY